VEKVCGIYKIENVVNGMIYIGSSSDVSFRLSDHKRQLKNKKHGNEHLQNAWNKYGKDNFRFIKLFGCEEHERCGKYGYEQAYFDLLWRYEMLYNINPVAEILTPPKKVYCFSTENRELLFEFNSVSEASRETGAFTSAISNVCKDIWLSAAGYYWSYSKELRVRPKVKRRCESLAKHPCCYKGNGDFIKMFYNCDEAGKEYKCHLSNINEACNGIRRTAGRVFWAWEGEYPIIRKRKTKPFEKKCQNLIERGGVSIETFNSVHEASKKIGVCTGRIYAACKSESERAGGFYWKYA